MWEFGGLWKHQNNSAYTKSVRVFILLKSDEDELWGIVTRRLLDYNFASTQGIWTYKTSFPLPVLFQGMRGIFHLCSFLTNNAYNYRYTTIYLFEFCLFSMSSCSQRPYTCSRLSWPVAPPENYVPSAQNCAKLLPLLLLAKQEVSMSAARYRNFFKLCEAWPVDPTKTGRDLSTVIRQRVADAFKMGENSQIANAAKCDKDYESLHRLTTNFYKMKYEDRTAKRTVGATGLSYEECRAVMATESLDELKHDQTSLFERLKQTFTAERPSWRIHVDYICHLCECVRLWIMIQWMIEIYFCHCRLFILQTLSLHSPQQEAECYMGLPPTRRQLYRFLIRLVRNKLYRLFLLKFDFCIAPVWQ